MSPEIPLPLSPKLVCEDACFLPVFGKLPSENWNRATPNTLFVNSSNVEPIHITQRPYNWQQAFDIYRDFGKFYPWLSLWVPCHLSCPHPSAVPKRPADMRSTVTVNEACELPITYDAQDSCIIEIDLLFERNLFWDRFLNFFLWAYLEINSPP